MRRNRGGFTIIEVMIFLVISGAMLAAAIIAINGQQNTTEFTQAMRDIDSKLQDTLNDVSTGNFNYSDKNCTVDPVSLRPGLTGVGGTAIGTRSDCLFLGEALQFSTTGTSGTPAVDNNTRFAVYTVLGRRLKAGATGTQVSVNSFSEANPTAIIGASGELTSYYNYEQGITATKIIYTPTGGGSPRGDYTLLGIYTGFTSAAGNIGNGSADASQTLQAYTYNLPDGTPYDSSGSPSPKNCIDSNDPTGATGSCPFDTSLSTGASKGLGICFNSHSGRGATALITIYNTDQGVNTRLDFNPVGVTC